MVKAATNRKKAAKEFADFWKNKGDERQETARFWIGLLEKVLGMENPAERIEFEKKVQLKHTSFIDAYIPETKVLIEQKSLDTDLRKEAKQSDGAMLTPYRQAKRYADEMPNSLRPDWIVVCNFREFLIYDMEKPHDEPVQVLLEELPDKFECLQFMVNYKKTSVSPEEQISLKAGELVGKLYDALLKEYINPDESSLRSLNILCVRIVFCLYAEDAGLFETRTAFEDYIKSFSLENLRRGLMDLFKIMNTKPENRDKYDTKINSFPYTNGGLFADDTIEIPNFTKEIVDVIVNHCAPFDWSKISPTIFGAVFESTLNPETRRKGGMHYTSIENIHKVIDPLFMDDLKAEFAKIVKTCRGVSLKSKLEDFRNKLACLKFLDPACGSGNFLTETYISLRRLENECLKVIHGSQMLLSSKDFSPIKVKISQFYGIEINDFAVTVAKTALWIAESQMMKETEEIVEQNLDFLPLSTSATIVEGNALRMDWRYLHEEAEIPTIKAKKTNLIYPMMVREKEVEYGEINLITNEINVGKPQHKQAENHYDYIMGNPPFVGFTYMSAEQKTDMDLIFSKVKNLDFVCAWYKKASDLIQNTNTKCAFVSTNSITQGEIVARFWRFLNIDVLFAYRTFAWDSESSQKAHVHCVIIGFFAKDNEIQSTKTIFFANGEKCVAQHINPYLLDATDIVIESRNKALCDVPNMTSGNKFADGGNLILTIEEYEDFVKTEPQALPFIKPLLGAAEFINGKHRFCLWLKDASPNEIRKCPKVVERVRKCKETRENSIAEGIRKFADTPTLFAQITQPLNCPCLVIPQVSSERRQYVPIGYLNGDTICTDKLRIIPYATLYHFGVLTSSVHMAWMRTICMRLESRYSYSRDIVYNNFPWPDLSGSNTDISPKRRGKEIEEKIEQTAQAILDARALFPDASLADLYDETLMPPELRKAHKENDKAVMAAYGFNPKMTEAEIVAELFKMYEKLTKKK